MSYDDQTMDLYRDFVIERHKIWQRRQDNEPGPWTRNTVLANRKFTNMFRLLDPGTQFVMTDLLTDDPADFITRCVLYRITNRPQTWQAMRSSLDRYPVVADLHLLTDLLTAYRDDGNKVFSGAYIIIPEPGTANDKVGGAVRVVRTFTDEGPLENFLDCETQWQRFGVLTSVPGIGKFLAMQILTDWTYAQPEQPEPSFIKAGPGAIRGAKFLNDTLKPEHVIRDLAYDWIISDDVLLEGRSLTAMDVQNTLCELGKYVKELRSPKKTTPYKPANPGPQPYPVLPAWW